MSLAIDADRVTHVLLADGWHQAERGSFGIDSYEFRYRHGELWEVLHGGGGAGICSEGFTFVEDGPDLYSERDDGPVLLVHQISGPLSAILAVRTEDECR